MQIIITSKHNVVMSRLMKTAESYSWLVEIIQQQQVYRSIPSNCFSSLQLFWQHLHLNYFFI